MSHELSILLITAASIGFFHTLFGPDHYLPFIVMARSGKWSLKKTTIVTVLCGLGHVLSSILLGFIGIAAGIAVARLELIEGYRGNLAAWLFIAFGLLYFVWGLRRAIRNKPHNHAHIHLNGEKHDHSHDHSGDHLHPHDSKTGSKMTPWILFTIFVFGPCEPLIPILMYPAARENTAGVILVATVFGLITIGTMLGVVLISVLGINRIPVTRMERFSHAIAGATIALSGMAIQFLGL